VKTFVISLNFERASLELRSRALPSSEEALQNLMGELQEKVWLSTCNRLELYAISDRDPKEHLSRWLKICGLSSEDAAHFDIYESEKMLLHLFRVMSSLASMVVGESQILGQVKRAYEEASHKGWVNTHLHKIFQRGFKVAKQVRSQTDVGRFAVSIPSIAVKLAEKVLGDLSRLRVGIIGLGEIGRNAAEHFSSVQPLEIMLYNRTETVADELASKLKAGAKNVSKASSLDELIASSDILVSAVDANLISEQHLRQLDSSRSLFLVFDLGVPASVPRLNLGQGFIYGIDDLRQIAEENNQIRRAELDRAEAFIQREAMKLVSLSDEHRIRQTLADLSKKAESLTQDEMKHLRLKLAHLPEKDWVEIEKMATRLRSKLLQDPVLELRSRTKSPEEGESFLDFFRSLFRV